ncbi:MAG: RluA family pseudouridine synthase [Saprospiraceae bacterium]
MLTPRVIYEDNHLLAIDKPPGFLVQGDHTGDRTLTDWAREYLKVRYDKPGEVFAHPTHRIDRPVSGAVLFARTSKALERLNAAFRERQVQKTYAALTLAPPSLPAATLRHFLLKDEKRNLTSAFSYPKPGAKEAILDYETVGPRGNYWLLYIKPHTGRPHQIRAQLGAIGAPIVGDLKYGADQPLPDASIRLHSMALELTHPVRKEPIRIFCEPPWLIS